MKALILAGGKSSRMGQDKASLKVQGVSLLDRLVEQLRPITNEIFLSVAHGDNSERSLPTLPDLEPSPGPLGGLQAAFAYDANCQWFIVGCDLPMLTSADFELLVEHQNADTAAACFLNPIDDQTEPLCALYSPSAAPALQEAISQNRRCARRFIASLETVDLYPTTSQSLLNLNRPEMLTELSHLQEHGVQEKEITVEYFAKLSQEAETESEEYRTSAATLAGLWEEVRLRHQFSLELPHVKPALDNEFADWSIPLATGQTIAFMPPFAGG